MKDETFDFRCTLFSSLHPSQGITSKAMIVGVIDDGISKELPKPFIGEMDDFDFDDNGWNCVVCSA